MLTLEEKEKWIAALESGDYSQTQLALRDEKGYCCLGVLCDVIDPTGWTPSRNGSQLSLHHEQNTFNSKLIQSKLSPIQTEELARMNDSEDASFSDIANWVRKNVNNLKVG